MLASPPISRCVVLSVAILLPAGCDSSAQSQSPMPPPPHPPGESKMFESCSSSTDCTESLRCIELVCRSNERSRLGDFHAAAGRRWLRLGDEGQAARSYNLAITRYETDGLEPPIELLCEQGGALAQSQGDSQLAEAASRLLHKCVLGVPPSSGLAQGAMDSLARLAEVGLEPSLLSRGEAADLYMTAKAKEPDLKDLKLSVTGNGKTRKRSYKGLIEALQTAENKAIFSGCWQVYWTKSRNQELSVTIPFTHRFYLDEDDAAKDRAVLKPEGRKAPADPVLAEASQCVEDAAAKIAEEVAQSVREDTRWEYEVTIRVDS